MSANVQVNDVCLTVLQLCSYPQTIEENELAVWIYTNKIKVFTYGLVKSANLCPCKMMCPFQIKQIVLQFNQSNSKLDVCVSNVFVLNGGTAAARH